MTGCKNMEAIVQKHKQLFSEELGLVTGVCAKIHIEKNAKPVFIKERPVPLLLKPKIEKELERLQQQGVIRPVHYSEWASPIVT